MLHLCSIACKEIADSSSRLLDEGLIVFFFNSVFVFIFIFFSNRNSFCYKL